MAPHFLLFHCTGALPQRNTGMARGALNMRASGPVLVEGAWRQWTEDVSVETGIIRTQYLVHVYLVRPLTIAIESH